MIQELTANIRLYGIPPYIIFFQIRADSSDQSQQIGNMSQANIIIVSLLSDGDIG